MSPETFCAVVDKQRADVAVVNTEVLKQYEEEAAEVPEHILALRKQVSAMTNAC